MDFNHIWFAICITIVAPSLNFGDLIGGLEVVVSR
jgi:hypothetical protein